jgi:nicotinamide mononucleotide adenylyltransferase
MSRQQKYDIAYEAEKWLMPALRDFNFTIRKSSDSFVVIVSLNCIIYINQDREGMINIGFSDPKDPIKRVFRWDILLQMNSRRLPSNYVAMSLFERLEYSCCNEIEEVLKGDFSWKEAYEEIDGLMKRLFKLEPNDPIYEKYSSGDHTWQHDLRQRLAAAIPT